MDIETLAVSEINRLIAMCPHLVPLLANNDKTPFTDGHIDVYDGLKRSNDEWAGRVPVQIKGRSTPKSGVAAGYRISRTDLKAFQTDFGVLYFVVFIDQVSGKPHPLYALLSPFYIEKLLNDAIPTTQKIRVPLKPFPTLASEIEGILQVALKSRDERPNAGDAAALFSRMQSLTIHSAQSVNFESPVSFVLGVTDYALVLNTTEGLSLPLGGSLTIWPAAYTPRVVDMTVACGEVEFKQATVRNLDEDTVEMKLSEGLSFRMSMVEGSQAIQATFALVGSLAQRIELLRFYAALLEDSPLVFNGKPAVMTLTKGDEQDQRRHLEYLLALAGLFEMLGVDSQLVNLDDIDAAQHLQLQHLHRAFVLQDEFVSDEQVLSRVLCPVGRWSLMFLIVPGSEPGSWRYVDPFSPDARQEIRVGRRLADGEIVVDTPATIYELVEQEHLPSVLNLRLDRIVEAYEAIAGLPQTSTLANLKILSLISAADAGAERNTDFLDAANALNEWVISDAGEEPPHLVNRWQILKRLGHLTTDHRREIRGLKRRMSKSTIGVANQIEISCALLLEDFDEADYCLEQLTPLRRDQLMEWPIWALRNPVGDAVAIGTAV